MRILFTALLLLLFAQPQHAEQPSLIVIISIDQFRYDYLTRFREHFGTGGFSYLLDNGANFTNATFKHALNMTGPGHAVIVSGSYGNVNGIVANAWYDTRAGRSTYCVGDEGVSIVGGSGEGRSPRNLIGSTIGDVLRLHTSFRSKVISVSLKDRAAVLMGGKFANAAFWTKGSGFVSSTYYMQELPSWVEEFNRSGIINSYFGRNWEKSLSEEAYAIQDVDDAPYESGENGLGVVFPHPITGNDRTRITSSYYDALATSPFGNEILAEFTKRAVREELLGKRGVPDLLCIGFSSNDYVGHAFGPHSHEVMDMTIHTDRVLAEMFAFLDDQIGLDKCVIVLSSDHGVAPIPEYVKAGFHNAEAGRVSRSLLEQYGSSVLDKYFKSPKPVKWVEHLQGGNIYLNPDAVKGAKVGADSVARVLATGLRARDEIAVTMTRKDILSISPSSSLERAIKYSFHPQRSGDVFLILKPYYIDDSGDNGTTHGQPYDYDAHVPVIFVGDRIRAGTYAVEASPVDIAPTLSALLGVEFPAGRSGRVLVEAFK